jgi:flagellar protein FliT
MEPKRQFRGMAHILAQRAILRHAEITTFRLAKNFQLFFAKALKFWKGLPLSKDNRHSGLNKPCSRANMTSNDVLAMYENIAGLTGRMAVAAKAGDWNGLDQLENQCAAAASATLSGVPALDGAKRLRKIDLLKQIMANDRAIRDATEPWMGQLDRVMQAH